MSWIPEKEVMLKTEKISPSALDPIHLFIISTIYESVLLKYFVNDSVVLKSLDKLQKVATTKLNVKKNKVIKEIKRVKKITTAKTILQINFMLKQDYFTFY